MFCLMEYLPAIKFHFINIYTINIHDRKRFSQTVNHPLEIICAHITANHLLIYFTLNVCPYVCPCQNN